MTNETALREAAIKVAAQIEMDREGYPLSRTQQEIYDDAAEIVDAVFALQSPSQPVVAEYHPSLELCVQFSDDGQHIRKWSRLPFDGGECLYSHPQASPPPVQAERVTGADIRHLAAILEEWDHKDPYNGGAGHAYEDIARDALARLAHSQPDTQEGDSVAFLATTDWSDEAKRSWEAQTGQPADQMPLPDMNEALCKIADAVVPEYRTTAQSYSCSGHHAKRWGAAYQGAFMAITGKSS